MRDIDFSSEPRPARPLRRAFAAALVMSLGIHIALLPQLHQLIRLQPTTPAVPRAPGVKVTFTSAPAKPDSNVEPAAEPIPRTDSAAVDTPPVASESATAASANPGARPLAPKTDETTAVVSTPPLPTINRDTLRAIAAEALGDEPESSGAAINGTVTDPRLISRLAQLREHKSASQLALPQDSTASFDGAAWSEFVQMGSRCFRVVAADPLTPGSQEMWYRQKCPS